MAKKKNEPEPSTWQSVADADWENAVDAWPWRSIGGEDWAKSGLCPHCNAEIHILKQSTVYAYITDPHAPDLGLLLSANHGPIVLHESAGRTFFARCNCNETHKKRPASLKYGCGRAGFIDGPPSDE